MKKGARSKKIEKGLRCRFISLPLFAAILLHGHPHLAVADSIWINPGTGSWFTGANWSTDSLPDSSSYVRIASGTAEVDGDGATASFVEVAEFGSGTLNITSGSLSNNNTTIGTFSGSNGVVSVSGGSWTQHAGVAIGYAGSGTLNISGGTVSGYAVLGSSTGTGTANVTGGTWSNSELSVGEIGTGILNVSGGTVSSTGNTWGNIDALAIGRTGSGSVTLSGSGIVRVGDGADDGKGTVKLAISSGSHGTLRIGDGGVFTGTLVAAEITGGVGLASVILGHSNDYTFTPKMTGSLSVMQTGPGTTTLTGGSHFTGGMTVLGGGIKLGSATGFGSSIGRLSVEIGTTDLNGHSPSFGALIGSPAGAITNSNVGTLSVLTAGNGINSGTFTYSGLLQDGGGQLGLAKSGNATLVLDGGNTYSGGTTISAGRLVVNNATGSGTGSGAITVGSSGTLEGSGIIAPNAGNNITINGTLAPGNSPGTLTFDLSGSSKLDFGSGSAVRFELGSTSDLIQFSNTGNWLSGSGNATLELTLGSGFDYNASYTIFANVTNAPFSFANITGYDTDLYLATLSFDGSDDSYAVSFSPIPEPAATSLFLVGTVCIFARHRGARRRLEQ